MAIYLPHRTMPRENKINDASPATKVMMRSAMAVKVVIPLVRELIIRSVLFGKNSDPEPQKRLLFNVGNYVNSEIDCLYWIELLGPYER